jgi:hypothetical protein
VAVVILACGVSLAVPARRHAVSDIYTTDHNRLPSVDCDAFGLTADVLGIKVWVIPLQEQMKKEHRQLYYVNGADYGCGGGLDAGLCKLNRQEWWRWLQEQIETIRST